jgi:hypothetical protein
MDFSVIRFECVCIYRNSAGPWPARPVAYRKILFFLKPGKNEMVLSLRHGFVI